MIGSPYGDLNIVLGDKLISLGKFETKGKEEEEKFSDIWAAIEQLRIDMERLEEKNAEPRNGLALIGEEVYLNIPDKQKKENHGKFAVIDTENKKVVAIEDTILDAMHKSRDLSDKIYYIRQFGMEFSI